MEDKSGRWGKRINEGDEERKINEGDEEKKEEKEINETKFNN